MCSLCVLLLVKMRKKGEIIHEVLALQFRKMVDIYSMLLSETSQKILSPWC